MLFSRSTFEKLGGFPRVADVLAEDFIIGKLFESAGLRACLGSCVVSNVTRDMTLRGFLARQLRWSMMRFRLRPFAAALEPLSSPLVVAAATSPALGVWALAVAALLLVIRDVGGWWALRGPQRLWVPLVLSPLRELLLTLVWLVAPFKRHVSWRGHRIRLDAGTLLFARSSHR
jgi:ceramide glucosyltransferase